MNASFNEDAAEPAGDISRQTTIRRQLMAMLQAGPCGVRELSQEMHLREKEIYAHLVHVEQTLRSLGKHLAIDPSVCLHCGFVFKSRSRPQPPGRCPQCKQTHIRRPTYNIR